MIIAFGGIETGVTVLSVLVILRDLSIDTGCIEKPKDSNS